MPNLSVNTSRHDPYRNFRFRIKIDNVYVAGLSKCTSLKRTTEMVEWREGGDPNSTRKLTGKTKYDPITLTAGVSRDTTFEDWANLVNRFQDDLAASLKARKDITIDVFNEADQRVLSYHVFRCWVSEFQAIPDLDASANAVMIQTIKLENEGWERDKQVPEDPEL